MKSKTEVKNAIESLDFFKFSQRSYDSSIKSQLQAEINELSSTLKSLRNNNFIVERSFFDNSYFTGILADNYAKDTELYNIRKDVYLFKVYVACGDYTGISYDVFLRR